MKISKKTGLPIRTRHDNQVKTAGKQPLIHKNKEISYDDVKGFVLDGEEKGAISYLSKGLGYGENVHEIGRILQNEGYIFAKPFGKNPLK